MYSVWNNYRFKRGCCIISPIFPRNHYSCLGMSSEIVFIKGKLNAAEYQELLHDELLPFITEIGDQKTIFHEDNAPIHTAAIIETWFQDFGIEFRQSRRG